MRGPGAIGVETTPGIYLIFWGPEWANGFTTLTRAEAIHEPAITELRDIVLSNLGGTSWAAIQTEYCNNVPAGPPVAPMSAGHVCHQSEENNSRACGPTRRRCPAISSPLGLAENVANDPLAMGSDSAHPLTLSRSAGDISLP